MSFVINSYRFGSAASPILDGVSNIALAFSLQQLRTDYTAKVVQVRRSSDNTTSDFTAAQVADGTLLAWVGTGGSDDGFVREMYCQGGTGRFCFQHTNTTQFYVVKGGAMITEGGIPTFSADAGRICNMATAASYSAATSRAYIAAYVHKGDKLGSGVGTVFGHGISSNNYTTAIGDRSSASRLIRQLVYTGSTYIGDTATDAFTPTTNSKYVFFHNIRAANDSTLHRNGTLQVTDSMGASSPETTARLAFTGTINSNGRMMANIFALIAIDADATSIRTDLTTKIMTRWSIT